MGDDRSQVSDATREAEAEEAKAAHVAGEPTGDADGATSEDHKVDDKVREHYREMTELGAHEVGEGRIP